MFKNRNGSLTEEVRDKTFIQKVAQYRSKTEGMFLAQLHYWETHPKGYGIIKKGKVWIYNTLEQWAEQLNVSKITIRRAISSLKSDGLINSEYLSPNRRNRTLYYSIDYEKVAQFLQAQLETNKNCLETKHEHIVEHMYIDNKIQNNKSDKSKILDHNFVKNASISQTTSVQDMLKVWNEEFSQKHIILDKTLARFLVAAFKIKFDSCLEKWRKYLQTIKTSAFLMSEKFKLSIRWVIKFLTIDRIRAGELGVDSSKIPVDTAQAEREAVKHINEVQESEKCKALRHRIVRVLSPEIYLSWFTRVKLQELQNSIVMETSNDFISDYISTHFINNLEKEQFEITVK